MTIWNSMTAPRRTAGLCCATFACALATADEARAGDLSLEIASHWGGPVNTVQVDGNTAYIGSGRRMVILDLTDVSNIVEIGSIDLMTTVHDLKVRDDWAYVATRTASVLGLGFCTVDISDPANPTLGWQHKNTGFEPRCVELYGDHAYVGGESVDAQIFDISAPDAVIPLGTSLTLGEVFVIENGLRFSAEDDELLIYDLTVNPLDPPVVGQAAFGDFDPFLLNADAKAIDVLGDRACITLSGPSDSPYLLGVVDISNPAQPVVLDASNTFGVLAIDVAIEGDLAFVADWANTFSTWGTSSGVSVFDLTTNPPSLLSTYKPHGDVLGVAAVGDRAFVMDTGEGLIVLDVSVPAQPVRIGHYHSPSLLRKMAKDGDLLYVVDGWNGFTVLDVSDAASPEVISIYQTTLPLAGGGEENGADNMGIALRDDLVYLAAGVSGLEVVDVSDPSNPTLVGGFPLTDGGPSTVRGLAVIENVAHLGYKHHTGTGVAMWYLTLNVEDHANISLLDTLPLAPSDAEILSIVGYGNGLVYCGNVEEQYKTIDASDPENLSLFYEGGQLNAPDVDLNGELLYIAAEDGLFVQDVTDPASPVDIGQVPISPVYGVDLHGDQAYLVGTDGRAYLYSVTNPNAPVWQSTAVLGGKLNRSFYHVLADEPHVYVTADANTGRTFGSAHEVDTGLTIIAVNGLPPEVPADLNDDGVVDAADLAILLGNWGDPGCGGSPKCPSDLTDDGLVNAADLAIVLGNWGPVG